MAYIKEDIMLDYRTAKSTEGQNEDEFRFKIVEKIGVVSQYNNGWTKEINIIEWNGREAKFDIRDWDPDHNRMRKGVTFFREEAGEIARILTKYLANTGDTVEKDDFDEPAQGFTDEQAASLS